ncbi:hypothetical protein DUNSADRAFT_11087 [Dunaliella salina]|uniref:Uncharacterized protein n=1 Tax=Dunaliella salina TaxID=3046 RepID=A0ABQ7GE34_DUNSA|nr:hypothetical protein DUNSADRAFT_11087 [Dunaliella salina]|eukprot:KAF5832867.1 hypothetical protein DUNSADRAFT_11087 [Dunaliella salina]
MADKLGEGGTSPSTQSAKDTRLPSHAAAALAAALNGPANGGDGSQTSSGGGGVQPPVWGPSMFVHRGFRSAAIAAAQAGGGGGSGGSAGVIMSSQVVCRVRAAYGAAAPVALRALGLGYFPDAQQVAASQREGSQLCRQYGILLDVALMLVPRTAQVLRDVILSCFADGAGKSPQAEGGEVSAAASALESCVVGLHGLMGADHLGADLVEVPVLLQALKELEGVVHNALAPMQWAVCTRGCKGWAPHMASLVTAVASFLKDLAQNAPPTCLLMGLDTTTEPHTPTTQPHSHAHANNSSATTGAKHISSSSNLSKADTGPNLCAAFVDSLLAVSSITTPFTLVQLTTQPTDSASSTHAEELKSLHPSTSGAHTARTQSRKAAVRSGMLVDESGRPAVAPLAPPSSSPAELQVAMDGGLVALLVAAQALLRKADHHHQQQQQQQGELRDQGHQQQQQQQQQGEHQDEGHHHHHQQQQQQQQQQLSSGMSPLAQMLPPLLHLSVRLLLTAPGGVQLHAAQRFFDSHTLLAHTTAERLMSVLPPSHPSHKQQQQQHQQHSRSGGSAQSGGHSDQSAGLGEHQNGEGSVEAGVLLSAAEGAVLCVARALRACLKGLSEESHNQKSLGHTDDSGSNTGRSNERGDDVSRTVLQPVRGVSDSLLWFRVHGPVCLSAAFTASGHSCSHATAANHCSGSSSSQGGEPCTGTNREQAGYQEGADGHAPGLMPTTLYLLGVVAEVLDVQGSCNHRLPSSEKRESDTAGFEPASVNGAHDCAEKDSDDGGASAIAGTADKEALSAAAAAVAAAEAARAATAATCAEVVDMLQAKVAEGMRVALQEGAASDAHPGKAVWAQQVLSAIGPLVAQLAHSRLQANADAQQQQHHYNHHQPEQQQQQQSSSAKAPSTSLLPLSTGSISVVTECLKGVVAAAHFSGAALGPTAQESIMQPMGSSGRGAAAAAAARPAIQLKTTFAIPK